MRRVVIVLVLALGCATARAEKSRRTAQILSGVGVGVSSALVLSSFLAEDPYHPVNEPLLYTGLGTSLFTPSLGEWYAGDWLTVGMGVRVIAVGLATVAVAHEQHDVTCDVPAPGKTCRAFTGSGIALLGIAGIAYIGGAAYDVNDAGAAVDRYNRRHLMVAPTALATPRGLAPGLALAGTF